MECFSANSPSFCRVDDSRERVRHDVKIGRDFQPVEFDIIAGVDDDGQAGGGRNFTLCGGHILPIYDGCLKEGIGVVDLRHEQAAAHAADAWARLTRNLGVAIVTAGPGVTDAVTGVANAYSARSPVLLIGGAAPLGLRGLGALQEMEQVALLRPITKGSWSVAETRQIPET